MAQRVFIVWTNPLFRETVSLLLTHPAISIIGEESDRQEARIRIRHLQPDTIIIEETMNGEAIGVDIIGLLESSDWEPRIARLSLQDNELRMYQRANRIIKTHEDLLNLIQDK